MNTREDKEYREEYGNIPDTQMERITYILGKKANNQKYNEMVAKEAKGIQRIKWCKLKFTMWKELKPSARPRVNTRGPYLRMYVPHAGENGSWFELFAKENNLPIISTPCMINMHIYEKTPSSFNMKNKILAELGIIRPWKRTGDFDNYAKAVADMMQHGMLEDDCLVIESVQKLYYSIKPHVDVEILYMKEWPKY